MGAFSYVVHRTGTFSTELGFSPVEGREGIQSSRDSVKAPRFQSHGLDFCNAETLLQSDTTIRPCWRFIASASSCQPGSMGANYLPGYHSNTVCDREWLKTNYEELLPCFMQTIPNDDQGNSSDMQRVLVVCSQFVCFSSTKKPTSNVQLNLTFNFSNVFSVGQWYA